MQYNLMYSLYSWPNTVQVFFGGYIIDKYVGVRWGCFICSLTTFLGQLCITMGVQTNVRVCIYVYMYVLMYLCVHMYVCICMYCGDALYAP